MSAVVVTSGGMDSTTAVYWAKKVYGDIECMGFDYGQRHNKELVYAAMNAEALDVPFHLVKLKSVTALIATSALTSDDIDVPEGHYAEESMKMTVVPNRNAMMLNIAIARAVAIEAECVITGVHAGDHAVYPDCRPEFIEQITRLALVANEGFINPDFQVLAPFVHMTKAEIATVGRDLQVPFHKTWSCYKGGAKHCGRCSTCVERLEAFHLAGVPDQTEYIDRNYWRSVVDAGV